jgi:hypothetical protein
MDQLMSVFHLSCRDRWDIISIVLNVARIPLFYLGSHKTDEDLVWVLSQLAIASGDASPLVVNGKKFRLEGSKDAAGGVFWVDMPTPMMYEDRCTISPAESITKANEEFVELDLLVFEDKPTKVSDTARMQASMLIEKFSLHDMSQKLSDEHDTELTRKVAELTIRVITPITPNGGPRATFLQDILGIAIDCGIDWIIHFTSRMSKATKDLWIHGTLDGYDVKFTSVAVDMLLYFGVSADNTSDFEAKYSPSNHQILHVPG